MLVARLRARAAEIEQEIFTRVREAVPDPAGDCDAEYLAGLRATVAAGVEFVLRGIEEVRDPASVSAPAEAVLQARRAARIGLSVEQLIRRYMVGQALLWEYILQEADRTQLAGEGMEQLREIMHSQAALVDRLVTDVAREHAQERDRARHSPDGRLLERVRVLLAAGEQGAAASGDGLGAELDYDLQGEHLGVIVKGDEAQQALRDLARRLDRRLLSVPCGPDTIWGWLGSRRPDTAPPDLEQAVRAVRPILDVRFAIGEPARGLQGWRLTHQQAQAALIVALRWRRALTRYRDVALLSSALKDPPLARALLEIYVAPLKDARNGGGEVLCQTLRAYLAAQRNVSCTAAALAVDRKTVNSRLRAIEQRLGRPPSACTVELQVALQLDELEPDAPASRR